MMPLNRFLELTGRLTLSSLEYDQAQQWGWDAMPPSIVIRALEEAIAKTPEARRIKARLSWYRHDVKDAYHDWRRAVGPY